MTDETKQRQRRSLTSHLQRAGILEPLQDDNVIELMLNPDGNLWVEAFGKPMYCHGRVSPADANVIIRAIAHYHEEIIDREKPILECELPLDGSRFEGVVPPLVPQPSFTIRKKATRVFTLADYVAGGIMSAPQRNAIERAIAARKNILVVGGTGSGKTTLVNAFIEAMVQHDDSDRFIILEDTNEIQCSAKNAVIMRTAESASVGMQRLLRVTLRYRPDRILVGEVRGGEALDLLKAWNTGHPGGTATIHANSALLGLERLEQCIEEVTPNVNRKVIASTINIVVFIRKTAKGREIKEIIEVLGYENGNYIVKAIA